MSKDSDLPEWYKIRSAFHGRGAEAYTTFTSRDLYARTLMNISDKLFWAPVALLITAGLTSSGSIFVGQCVIAFGCFVGAIYTRHVSLSVLDSLPESPDLAARTAAIINSEEKNKENFYLEEIAQQSATADSQTATRSAAG